ncbi:MAG: AI-2E family transporter [Lentisphaeria bacterium]|nr:AI-2E family transporter [Lentisphaeria bacterium]
MNTGTFKSAREWTKNILGRRIERAYHSASELFTQVADENSDCKLALMQLIHYALRIDGDFAEDDFSYLREILRDVCDDREIRKIESEIKKNTQVDLEQVLGVLASNNSAYRDKVLMLLVRLIFADGECDEVQRGFLGAVAQGFDISSTELERFITGVRNENEQREKILKSGAGIVVALVVILVFILTATWLRSVIFGLILSYLFLPLERFFERRLRERGLIVKIFSLPFLLFSPLKLMAKRLTRRSEAAPSPAVEQQRAERALINRASSITVLIAVIGLLVLFLLGARAMVSYFVKSPTASAVEQRVLPLSFSLKSRTQPVEKAESAVVNDVPVAAAPQGGEHEVADSAPAAVNENGDATGQFFNTANDYLNRLRGEFEGLALVQWGISAISRIIENPVYQEEIVAFLFKKSGGFVSFAFGFFSVLAGILVDVLLTIFFFSLFLKAMAVNIRKDGNATRNQSDYIVRMFFNGKWLPEADERIIEEGRNIIGEIITRLKTWLRGYLTLIAIDMTVYTTVFCALDLPYAVLLGVIAGCGPLLPYIGPVASCLFTLLLTLAVGGSTVGTWQIFGIVGIYLLQNGIIEQFILYPSVIGESLGLTTLETIIVVLLGGIFAGISGMIFAIPAISILKYLVPKIYDCWSDKYLFHRPAGESGKI